jgi:endogenous inhibitor of DNA gyrase (YacG/DUF329 family)
MAMETRVVLDPKDILALQLECLKCPGAVTFQPDQNDFRPFECPNCGVLMLAQGTKEMEFLKHFTKVLGFLSGARERPDGFRFRLQVPAVVTTTGTTTGDKGKK